MALPSHQQPGPEYEIVYIEGASDTRHVGDHISRCEGSDLVFIGPKIPHLNYSGGPVRLQRQDRPQKGGCSAKGEFIR